MTGRESDKAVAAKNEATRAFALVAGLAFLNVGFAWLLGLGLGEPLLERLAPGWGATAAGVAATAPLCLFLWWFMRTAVEPLARFRQSQIEAFAGIGFDFTAPRIIVLAIGAGVGEELLFRDVLQDWMAGWAGLALAIVATNVVFGLLHRRGVIYVVIAGLVGAWMGVLYAVTGSLLAPIIAHTLYDTVALAVTGAAVARWRRDRADAGTA